MRLVVPQIFICGFSALVECSHCKKLGKTLITSTIGLALSLEFSEESLEIPGNRENVFAVS